MTTQYVSHPLIQAGKLEERSYQTAVVQHAKKENLLVVMPTGLGKTAIAMRTIAEWLEAHPSTRTLMVAPTRPLVEQHARTVEDFMNLGEPLVLTGTVSPAARHAKALPHLVLATPQVIRNDLLSGSLSLEGFSLVVFDEAHRATGDYPYVAIAARARELGARILGITASPGSRVERIREVMENLGISPSGLEFRGESDPDVLPYMHDILFDPVYVDKPKEVEMASLLLKRARDRHVEALASYYAPIRGQEMITKTMLLDAGRSMGGAISQHRALGTKVPAVIWQAQKHQAVAMKIVHALELMETQGVPSLGLYIKRMAGKQGKSGKMSPSTREFLADADVRAALDRAEAGTGEHPKIAKVVELVREGLSATQKIPQEGEKPRDRSRVIVFAHYRDTAEILVKRLMELGEPGIRPVRFVGQASRDEADQGLTQKEQVEILDQFRSGRFNCLVATSVAEEGLDIPSTDLVIFYEPVPSEIRTIQRRGRTGRSRAGRVVVLLARGTQDVGSFFSAKGKERKMRELIEQLRGTAVRARQSTVREQSTLDGFLS